MAILCSIVLSGSSLNGELLSLVCAVAIAETIGRRAKIKWPNDIILNGRKVAGLLCEAKQTGGTTAYVIGIGINCHQKKDSFPAELQETATSIDIEKKTTCDRNSLAKRLLSSIDHWLKAAEKKSSKVTDRWSRLSVQLGHRVTLLFNGKKFTGNCIGIDPKKGLILQLDRGAVRMFDAAHTTIVK
jgi:BirA family biotin operon repressor/biotin-[acetyl-CoA-carboxylase] ligase